MTKKDFELIARVLRSATPAHSEVRRDLANAFADGLRMQNDRFDARRFIAAVMRD